MGETTYRVIQKYVSTFQGIYTLKIRNYARFKTIFHSRLTNAPKYFIVQHLIRKLENTKESILNSFSRKLCTDFEKLNDKNLIICNEPKESDDHLFTKIIRKEERRIFVRPLKRLPKSPCIFELESGYRLNFHTRYNVR